MNKGAYFSIIRTLCFFMCLAGTYCDEHSHIYQAGEEVVVWANTVGPHANRQETYEYFQLPYCVGQKQHDHYHETLGEALQGMELVNTGIDIRFLKDVEIGSICSGHKINAKQIGLFEFAIAHQYHFHMFLDDLPIGGFVGQIDPNSGDKLLFMHQDYEIIYNKDRIIAVNLNMGNPVAISGPSMTLNFTYSVKWTETQDKFEDRFDRLLDSEFFEHKIHWFSIFNSFMMVIFLIAFVGVILLRTLRMDFARYEKHEELGDLDRDLGEDYGWKQVHGDVFRPPPNQSLLAALLGTGYQLVILASLVILYTIMGDLYVERASILTVTIFLYALTSVASGYYSGSFYAQYGGKNWIRTMVMTAGLWPGFVTAASILINFVAIYYSSTKAIPFGTMIAILSIWIFLVFPLTLLGSIVGRNWAGKPSFPTRVNPIPRPIPEKPWYLEPIIIILLGGLLPFGSIFIEMYFVFTSFWAYKIYYVYGFMFLVLLILVIVTACVSIVSTYFLLNSEDYRWHWVSFMTGGSISFYVYLYAIYYFFARTKMYGLFQTTFYFGYTAVICFGLLAACGSVGFLSSSLFLRRIYATVKID